MGHVPLDQLNDQIESAKMVVVVGGKYAHYKDSKKLYTVTDLLIIESTDEVGVMYRPADAPVSFVRPLHEWLQQVEYLGKKVPRFTHVQ